MLLLQKILKGDPVTGANLASMASDPRNALVAGLNPVHRLSSRVPGPQTRQIASNLGLAPYLCQQLLFDSWIEGSGAMEEPCRHSGSFVE